MDIQFVSCFQEDVSWEFHKIFQKTYFCSDQLLKLEYAYYLVNGNKSDNNNNTQENQAMIKILDTFVYSI